MSEKLMSVGAAARALGISSEYLRHLADEGKVPVERTSTGQRIFRQEDIQRLKAVRESDSSSSETSR